MKYKKMELLLGKIRIELTTSRFSDDCSTTELLPLSLRKKKIELQKLNLLNVYHWTGLDKNKKIQIKT